MERANEEFSPEYLARALGEYIEQKQAFTATGAVDFDRLAIEFETNHATVRQILSGQSSLRWGTWETIMDKLGKKVVVEER